MTHEKEFFGFERLKELQTAVDGLPAKKIQTKEYLQKSMFTGSAPQLDDMTVVIIKVE